MKLPSVAAVVSSVWALVCAGVGVIGLSFDFESGLLRGQLVAQPLRFISTAIHSGCYKDFFGSTKTIGGLAQVVFVPNVTLQQFEDERLGFIRLVLPGAVATADALQAVVGSRHEMEAMEIVGCGSLRGSPHISARKTRAEMGERRGTARNILAQVTSTWCFQIEDPVRNYDLVIPFTSSQDIPVRKLGDIIRNPFIHISNLTEVYWLEKLYLWGKGGTSKLAALDSRWQPHGLYW
ncbi:hypothetical protein FIBSPDRAFT_892342 [Athelia psychrophila]|uniref:Uncharacterized protein n=1 Tax=Athelia psychrophila TaxID=1759441 RepID=A0A166ILK3_9AGAM|nr:hypothetical protein FIBSPDRAFT_892342 [Fibularhizoctonia sp. CBS 109695]